MGRSSGRGSRFESGKGSTNLQTSGLFQGRNFCATLQTIVVNVDGFHAVRCLEVGVWYRSVVDFDVVCYLNDEVTPCVLPLPRVSNDDNDVTWGRRSRGAGVRFCTIVIDRSP